MVWFLNTVQVRFPHLGSGECGDHHHLLEDLDSVVSARQLEHARLKGVAGFGCFPSLLLLAQDRPGRAEKGRRVGGNLPTVLVGRVTSLPARSGGLLDHIRSQWLSVKAAKARRSALASVSIAVTLGWGPGSIVVTSANSSWICSASGCVKSVQMIGVTISWAPLGTTARMFCMKPARRVAGWHPGTRN